MVSLTSAPVLSENLHRLASFATFPSWSPVFTSSLSSAGFSYQGKSDFVTCTACNLQVGNWKENKNQEPLLVHLTNSPDCQLAQTLRKLAGIPEPKIDLDMKKSFVLNKTDINCPNENLNEKQIDCVDGPDSGNFFSDPSATVSSSSVIPNVPPRYQDYTLPHQRLDTFASWPRDHPILPHDLSKAGFFFTGIDDLVRCFNCGGGLTRWDTDDNPWVEHARWFPKCTFLRQNKGDDFIQTIQDMVKQVELEEQLTQTHQNSASRTPSAAEENIEQLVAVRSVRELGYSMDVIKAAYKDERQKHRDGEISAAQLLEQVLENEDKNSCCSAPDSENISVSIEESKIENCESRHQKSESSAEESTGKSTAASDILLCKVCMEEQVSIVFLPCGHLVTCGQCAPAMRKCPLCRAHVKSTVKTYLS